MHPMSLRLSQQAEEGLFSWKSCPCHAPLRHGTDVAAGSCRRFHQIPDAHQVVRGRRQGEEPADSPHAPELDHAQQPHGLQPAEDLFHSFPFLLTDRVAGVSRGSALNRTGTVRRLLWATCGVTCRPADPERMGACHSSYRRPA